MRRNQQNRAAVLILGNNIRKKREQKGWTQKAFGDLLGFSRPSIINIESGKHACTLETLMAICTLLDCEIWDLAPSIKDGTLPDKIKQFKKEQKQLAEAKKQDKINKLKEQINKIKKG